MMLSEPPKWKMKKIPISEFNDIVDEPYGITTSIRYGRLKIVSSEINVKYDKETGEFRFSGEYALGEQFTCKWRCSLR